MLSSIAIGYFTLLFAGQIGLLALLLTLYWVPGPPLPQRANPFFMNMLFVMFLSTIPSIMLLITGQQEKIKIQSVCLAQSALMDAIPSMWGTAVVVLVIQLWYEIRQTVKKGKDTVDNLPQGWLFISLLLLPYLMFLVWAIASFIGSIIPPVRVGLKPFLFCTDKGPTHHLPVRFYVGPFAAFLGVLAVTFEIMTAKLLLSRIPKSEAGSGSSSVWSTYQHTTIVSIYFRLLVFNFLQLGPLVCTLLSRGNKDKSRIQQIDDALQILEALYPLGIFLLFASQKNILQSWRILPRPFSPPRKMSLC